MSEKVGLSVKKSGSKEKGPVSSRSKANLSQLADLNSPVEQVLHLQRTIGNETVTRLIQSGVLQAKLKIGQPNDVYEQEADRVADQVMRMSGESLSRKEKGPGCPGCSEKEEVLVQAKGNCGQSSDISSCVESHISALKGKGRPLSSASREYFEPRFGSDFSRVQLHTGPDAAAIATEINALAFTSGRDIFFGSGQYSPSTSGGKRLIAHELTHVLQQQPGRHSLTKKVRKIENGDIFLQRYSLNGFPPAKASQMHTAISSAKSTVSSCGDLSWYGKIAIPSALDSKRYDYVEDLGYCGWTFPGSWYIEVGPSAFTSSCCRLDSTLAHEAAHTVGYTEGSAYEMECDCFSCGCS